jgi:hypothetical protein
VCVKLCLCEHIYIGQLKHEDDRPQFTQKHLLYAPKIQILKHSKQLKMYTVCIYDSREMKQLGFYKQQILTYITST